MTVYKSFIKLLAKERISILLSLLVSLLPLALIIFSETEEQKEFQTTPLDLAVVNESDSELASQMIDYFEETNRVEIKNEENEKDLRQQLYVGLYDAVIKIPSDFEERLFQQEETVVEIESNLFPETRYLSFDLVNKYLRYADTFLTSNPELTAEQLKNKISNILQKSTEVSFIGQEKINDELTNYYPSLALLAWIIMQTSLGILGNVMLSFREEEIQSRVLVSGLSSFRYNLQVFFAQITYGVGLFGISFAFLWIMLPDNLAISWGSLAGTLATYIFASLGLSFLLTQMIENRYLHRAITLVITLVLSFISGVFIPVDLLSDSMRRLASFSPMYYYYDAITKISSSANEVIYNWAILFAFGVVFIFVGLVFARQKQSLKR